MKTKITIKHISKTTTIFLAVVFLFVPSITKAANWYVDNAVVANGNGQSWNTAWKSFTNIQWSFINPGDTLYISGGTTSKNYNEQLEIAKSGSAGNPITIKIGQETGHNGLVIINRGGVVNTSGIIINAQHHIVISGQYADDSTPRLRVTGTYYSGLEISGASYALDLSYLDIMATAQQADGTYGVLINVSYNAANPLGSMHNCIFHNIAKNIAFEVYSSGVATTFDWFTFHDNDLYDIEADYVYLVTGGVSIYNNKFRDKKPWIATGFHTDGIHGGGPYVKIYNNQFSNFVLSPDDEHINAYIRFMPNDFYDYTDIGHVYIYNNTFADTNPPSSGDAFRAIEMGFGGGDPGRKDASTAQDIYIANNTFMGIPFIPMILSFNGSYGNYAMSSADVSNIYFVNNIFKDLPNVNSLGQGSQTMFSLSTGNGVTYGSWGDSTDVVIDYNLAYASSTPPYGTQWNIDNLWLTYTTMRTTAGCQEHAPVNPIDPLLNSNYTLQANSPAKETGISLASKFNTDKAGINRPQGSAWDIGAYEYTSGQTTCTPADANSDGSINISDVQTCINVILQTDTNASHKTCSDMNGDTNVNIADCQAIINKILNP